MSRASKSLISSQLENLFMYSHFRLSQHYKSCWFIYIDLTYKLYWYSLLIKFFQNQSVCVCFWQIANKSLCVATWYLLHDPKWSLAYQNPCSFFTVWGWGRGGDSYQQHMEGTSRRAVADKLSSILLQYFVDNFDQNIEIFWWVLINIDKQCDYNFYKLKLFRVQALGDDGFVWTTSFCTKA